MSQPLLKYREPVTAQDILTEAMPRRIYTEGSALNLARAALFGVPLYKVESIVELLRLYRGGKPNSIIIGGPLGWAWQATLDTTHHGALAGPANAHQHSDLANVGPDDHHNQLHPTEHQDGGVQEISIAGLSGEPVELTTHKGLESAHHTKFTIAEHDVVARHPLSVLDPAVCSETEADGKVSTHDGLASPHAAATAIGGKTLGVADGNIAVLPTATEKQALVRGPTGWVAGDPIPKASDESGNFTYTTAYGTAEQDISALFTTALTGTTRRKYMVYLDLTNFEVDGNFANLYVAVKAKVDGTNYRAIDRKTIAKADIAALAEPGVVIMIPSVAQDVQITFQMSATLASNRVIYYHYVKEFLE